MRKNRILCLLLGLLCLFSFTAAAAETGSLRIVGIDNAVCLYHVATADAVLTEAFALAPVEELTEQQNAVENAKILYAYALENAIAGQEAAPDEEGEVLYTPLEEGLYLVCSLEEEMEFSPFLVSIPTIINDQVIYHVEAKPKEDEPTEPSDPSDPTEPTEPSDPTEPTEPTEPDPDIPQTGTSVIPKYLLMTLGTITVIAGFIDLIRGREQEL